ncbi:uncharacterized protein A1O9_02113 [Exophiala aquamarina CBS 119918]|uniref:Uncharacterized protein n=1 Tax=Exophiala aquamarina CBS 119918 TaxID=1182545 RepID=A0A072PLB1_9EURO|nr:uncharacterized protein A1O9_02113 [Exophiala aquamarina CBS 119918]KEF60552.1 hypothetical protein A1O9_02113 [Exophiala aquamarina CBS 119918]
MGPPPPIPSLPLVPSKAALRVLRRLAWSPATLVITAFSSACGIAAVNHDVHRRIHLAEQVIETKNILRSVSHGTAESHLESLFRAAERGEDCTMHSKSRKGSRSSPTSTVFAKDKKESDHLKVDSRIQPKKPLDQRRVVDSEEVEQDLLPKLSKIRGARQKKLNNPELRHLDAEEVKYVAGQSDRVNQYKANKQGSRHLEKEESRRLARQSVQVNQYKDSPISQFKPYQGISQPERIRSTTRIPHSPAYLQVRVFNHAGSRRQSKDQSNDLRSYSITADGESALQGGWCPDGVPWRITPRRLKANIMADRTLSELPQSIAAPLLDINTPPNLLPPSSQNASRELKNLLGSHKYHEIITFIFQQGRHISLEVARWHLVLRYFLAQALGNRMRIAAGLVLMYRFAFPLEMCTLPPVLKIVEHFLEDESCFDKAGEILFPSLSSDLWQNPEKTNDSLIAVAYLKHFLETHQDLERWSAELKKVLFIAKGSSISLGEDFAVPVIECLCHAGDMDRVVITMDELEKHCGVSLTHASLETLSKGYAVAGEWQNVATVLELMHSKGYSRAHPERCQSFYARLIELYSTVDTAENCFGFTILAIKTSGLIPGTRVSRAIICASIRDGRHELILEWGRLVDKVYTRLEPPFSLLEGGLQFSAACKYIGASCVEIASACRAIAYGARKDPFSKYFRGSVSALVREDLIYRLQALGEVNQSIPDDLNSTSTDELIALARGIEYNKPKFLTTPPVEAKLERELAQQVEAIEELKIVFEGGWTMNDLYGDEESRKRTPNYQHLRRPLAQEYARFDQAPSSMPECLKQSRRSSYREILEAISQDYMLRTKAGETIDHSLLKYAVRQLTRCFRDADAIRLICAIYESDDVRGVRGIPFDEELFTMWIHLATASGTQDSMKALWALIDSLRLLRFTNDFQLLTLYAYVTQQRRSLGMWAEEWAGDPKQPTEIVYAYLKLATARDSSNAQYHMRFPTWKRWEEAMRARAFDPDPWRLDSYLDESVD